MQNIYLTKMSTFLLLLLSVICIKIHIHNCKVMTTLESHMIMEKLFRHNEFARWAIPADRGNGVTVQISLTFIDMVPLDFHYNHIFAEVLIHQEWKDERLAFNSSLQNATIILTGDNVDDIWLPDTWITNERGEPKTAFPASESTAQLTQDGYVHYSARFSIYVFCPMDYTYFPFDRQKCLLPFESYGYNTEMMRLIPTKNIPTVSFRDDFRIKEFILDQSQGVEVVTSEVDYGLTGKFDRVEISLSLRRHVYYYLVEYYFPVALVVATSWISFWIDNRCTAARATLPVTTFLTLTTMAETLRAKDAGSLSHSTMFEIYINVCTFYVVAVLIEYAIIEATYHLPKSAAKSFKKAEDINHPTGIPSQFNESIVVESVTCDEQQLGPNIHTAMDRDDSEVEREDGDLNKKSSEKYENEHDESFIYSSNHHNSALDEYSKAVFPISFLLFILCYALVCLSAQ